MISNPLNAEEYDEYENEEDGEKISDIYDNGGVKLSKKENNDKRDKVSGQSQNMDARNMERKFEKQSQHQQTDKDTADKLGTKGEADSSLEKVFRSAYKNRGKKGKGRYTRNDGKGTGGDKEYSFDDRPKISRPKTRKPRRASRGTKRSGLNMSEFGIDEKEDSGSFQVGGNKEDNTMEKSETKGRDGLSSGFWSFWGGGGSETSTKSSASLTDSDYYDDEDDSLVRSKDMYSMWSESDKPKQKSYAFPEKEYDDYYYNYDEVKSTTKKPRKVFPFLRTFGLG